MLFSLFVEVFMADLNYVCKQLKLFTNLFFEIRYEHKKMLTLTMIYTLEPAAETSVPACKNGI